MSRDRDAVDAADNGGNATGLGQLLDRLARLFARPPIAPFAIPLLVWMPIWLKNRYWSPIADFTPSLFAMLLVAFLILICFWLYTRDWRRASIWATIATAFLLYTPSLAGAISRNPSVRFAIIGSLGLLAIAIARKVPRGGDVLSRANGYLSIALLSYLLPTAATVLFQAAKLEAGRPDPHETFQPFLATATEESPDVWNIVMDRYPNSETLARIYGIDNSEFLNALKARGFAVNENAHSNYQVTNQSLASTLNADHLHQFASQIGSPLDTAPMFDAVRRNRATQFFSENGYRVIFAGSWANITNTMEPVDEKIVFRDLSEVQRIVFEKTVPGEIARYLDLPYGDRQLDQCLREKFKFQELGRIAKRGDQKFVFAHFLIPHPPFVFGPGGDCQSWFDQKRNTRQQNFELQIRYANAELIRLIDRILSGPRPATILLHGDEGPFPAQFATDEAFHSSPLSPPSAWKEAGPALWKEKMGILMAVRHAEGETTNVPSTPINLYPLVLNRDFSGRMEMRQERSYFYPDPKRKFDYVDVTEDLHSAQ